MTHDADWLFLSFAFWGVLFAYLHLYKPPRKPHNDKDMEVSLDNLASYLGYDLVTFGSKNREGDEITKLIILSHPEETKELMELMSGEEDIDSKPKKEE